MIGISEVKGQDIEMIDLRKIENGETTLFVQEIRIRMFQRY